MYVDEKFIRFNGYKTEISEIRSEAMIYFIVKKKG